MADAVLWPVIGHQTVVSLLQRSLLRKTVSHAYLFVGPAQVGKTTIAEQFAAALMCDIGDRQGYACDECRPCHQRTVGVHPDYFVLTPFNKGGDTSLRPLISLEDVKQLQVRLSRRPVLSARNVALISGAEFLSEKAANALLKTIEEPGQGSVILITCDAAEQVPSTLRSRCSRIVLSLVSKKEIDTALRDRGVVHQVAERIAGISFGRPGRALDFVSNPGGGSQYEDELRRFNEYLRQSVGSRLQGVMAWHRDAMRDETLPIAEQLHHLLSVWANAARSYLLLAAGCSYLGDLTSETAIPSQTTGQWLKFIDEVHATQAALRQNVNPRLALEVLLLAMPQLGLSAVARSAGA